jgi:polar amino acid transport system permease protein
MTPGPKPTNGPRNAVLLAAAGVIGCIIAAISSPPEAGLNAALASQLLSGLGMTVFISAASAIGGAVIGVGLLLVRTLRVPLLDLLGAGYVTLFRGTPLIAQLYLVYYGAGEIHGLLAEQGLWWAFREPLSCVFIVFAMNSAAYQVYIVEGALRSLPREQTDAARALGLSHPQALLKVLMPQAMLVALRPLANEATKIIKGSAVASVVTVFDLLGATKLIYGETFDFSIFYFAASLYVVMIGVVRYSMQKVEERLLKHLSLRMPTRPRAEAPQQAKFPSDFPFARISGRRGRT